MAKRLEASMRFRPHPRPGLAEAAGIFVFQSTHMGRALGLLPARLVRSRGHPWGIPDLPIAPKPNANHEPLAATENHTEEGQNPATATGGGDRDLPLPHVTPGGSCPWFRAGGARCRGGGLSHLDHVDEVGEVLLAVNAERVLLVHHAVVHHLPAEAHAQHIVAGVPDRLAHQEQPVLGGLQLLHRLHPRDLPVEPAGERGVRTRGRADSGTARAEPPPSYGEPTA